MILTVRDIEELIFCPRLFYYHAILGIETYKSFWKDTGKNFEKNRIKQIVNELNKEFMILEDKIYESKKLKLRGKPDLVLKHKKYKYYVIVEIKNSSKVKPEFLGTLFVYSILLEDCGLFPVKEVFLILKNNIYKYEISDIEREKAYNYLKQAFEIINGKIPKGNSKNCHLCDLRGVCDEGHSHN